MKLDKNYKVRVTPEQSRKIQELAFELGFEWYFSGKQILHTEISNLTLGINCMVLGCFENNKNFYADTRFAEISADDLIALITDLSKSAENPLQGVELTPEFETEASEPKFKVGDPVYCPLQTKELCKVFSNDQEFQPQCPLTITEVRSRHSGVSGAVVACVDDYGYSDEYDNAPFIFHATPENHALLSKLYPHIEFEQPAKELKGDDLVDAMLKKGVKNILCLDEFEAKQVIVGKYKSMFVNIDGFDELTDLTPIDWVTDQPLTESVLND